MENSNVEKPILTSKDFTKKLIKIWLFNQLIWILIISILAEVADRYMPNIGNVGYIVVTVLLVVLIVKKVYLEGIESVFQLGRVNTGEVEKIKRNIGIIFLVFLIILVAGTVIKTIISANMLSNLGFEVKFDLWKNILKPCIIPVLIQFGLYFICRYKFIKECEKTENIA